MTLTKKYIMEKDMKWSPGEISPLGQMYLPFIGLENPKHPQNLGKKYFEVKIKKNSDGSHTKSIWIDGVHLDYSIEIEDYWRACKMGFKQDAQKSIAKHFINAVSEMVGRKVTAEEIIKAHKTCWI